MKYYTFGKLHGVLVSYPQWLTSLSSLVRVAAIHETRFSIDGGGFVDRLYQYRD